MNENTKRKKSEKNMKENIKANLCCWNNGREKNEEIIFLFLHLEYDVPTVTYLVFILLIVLCAF